MIKIHTKTNPCSTCKHRRDGLTLLEVLVSMAIFLFALAAIGQLITYGSERAQEARWRQQGAFLAQAKLDEISVGAAPLESVSNAAFTNLPDWSWSSVSEADSSAPGLYRVTVTVQRQRPFGNPVQVTLIQLVLDPAIRGTTMDPTPKDETTEDTTTQGSSSSSGGGSAGGSGGSAGGN